MNERYWARSAACSAETLEAVAVMHQRSHKGELVGLVRTPMGANGAWPCRTAVCFLVVDEGMACAAVLPLELVSA